MGKDKLYIKQTFLIDVVKYFEENAGKDDKLSWEEMQKAPIEGGPLWEQKASGYNLITTIGIEPSKSTFEQAQNTKYDGDPDKLNFREFAEMVENMGGVRGQSGYVSDVQLPPHTTGWHGSWIGMNDEFQWIYDEIDDEIPPCAEQDVEAAGPKAENKVRTAIRNGIASAIEDSWPTKKEEIDQAIEKGNLTEVVGLLNGYLPIVATTTRHYNPELYRSCFAVCSYDLFEIEEMASKKSLKDKTIRGFWDDVAKIFQRVLKQAKTQGVDIKDIFDVKWDQEKILYFTGKYLYPGQASNFTLMSLMEKANPKTTKEIAAAIKESANNG